MRVEGVWQGHGGPLVKAPGEAVGAPRGAPKVAGAGAIESRPTDASQARAHVAGDARAAAVVWPSAPATLEGAGSKPAGRRAGAFTLKPLDWMACRSLVGRGIGPSWSSAGLWSTAVCEQKL